MCKEINIRMFAIVLLSSQKRRGRSGANVQQQGTGYMGHSHLRRVGFEAALEKMTREDGRAALLGGKSGVYIVP